MAELDQNELDALGVITPVCALCRAAMGPGMQAMLFHPDHYRGYLKLKELEAQLQQMEGEDDPVMVCLPCGNQIQDAGASRRPS